MTKPKSLLMLAGACALAACQADESATATVINFGNNSSEWSFDGECDDPRFRGPGAATTLLAEDAFRDATDCRALFEAGALIYIG